MRRGLAYLWLFSKSVGLRHGYSLSVIQKHSLALKPSLTKENKLLRIGWCSDHVNHNTGQYSEMLDFVHVNEKWFNLIEVMKSCYLTADEVNPYCNVCHQSHIPHIMFFAAVARPCYDPITKTFWDGKNWHLGMHGLCCCKNIIKEPTGRNYQAKAIQYRWPMLQGPHFGKTSSSNS